MRISVKICGITSRNAMEAACTAGADYVGLNFYPPSPRYLSVVQAAELAQCATGDVKRVGIFVDAPENVIEETLEAVPLEALQFHGSELPAQVASARARFGLPVIRAVKLAAPEDLQAAAIFEEVADMILFDAKPPPDRPEALPGGNALSFDWRILAGYHGRKLWGLSGGLRLENLTEAIEVTGAVMVDVSSGVESAPGVKDPRRIAAFIAAAHALRG